MLRIEIQENDFGCKTTWAAVVPNEPGVHRAKLGEGDGWSESLDNVDIEVAVCESDPPIWREIGGEWFSVEWFGPDDGTEKCVELLIQEGEIPFGSSSKDADWYHLKMLDSNCDNCPFAFKCEYLEGNE